MSSQFMDKQVMDLSNSLSAATNSHSSGGNNDFIDFMNPQSEKKDDIVASYDFMPIRPGVGSSSSPPPPANRSLNSDSGDDDVSRRPWNSLDSKINASSIRNYSSADVDKPAKFMDVTLVTEIDMTVKKYTDSLMHALDGVSARISQLETRTRKLESSMDDLKVSIGNNQGSSDGKMRQMENILREVQTGVQVIKDKQEIIEAQMQISKMQFPYPEQVKRQETAHSELSQAGASAHQQFSTISLSHPPPTLPSPNAPMPPPPQQNIQSQVQFPNQISQNQIPSVPQQESYFPPLSQIPENLSQQYQIPPPHQHQHQHQSPSQSQDSQSPPPSQPHPSFSSALSHSMPQSPLGHHHEETSYPPPQAYPSGIRPSPSHPSTGGVPPQPPSSQQFYSPTSNSYEPQSSRPSPGYPNLYGPPSGISEPYPYSSSPSQYGSDSARKHQISSTSGQSSGSGNPQLPTARILPQAIPTASSVGGGSGPGGSGNKVPIDDVVEKVASMGFPRDLVRATVRRLTENGQSVDLNVVLDKLMNDGDVQTPRGWFGR